MYDQNLSRNNIVGKLHDRIEVARTYIVTFENAINEEANYHGSHFFFFTDGDYDIDFPSSYYLDRPRAA